MKNVFLKLFSSIFIVMLVFTACNNDDETVDPGTQQPSNLTADNIWADSTIAADEIIWFKVIGAELFTTLYVEWAEADYHGTSKEYNADIKVSAYMLDGVTPYFENENTGYKDAKKEIALAAEKEVLIKIECNDATRIGSFSVRATGTAPAELVYKQLPLADAWTVDTIELGETIGYSVDCGDTQIVGIIWAEIDSPEGPEAGFTAEIMGSVFHKDGITVYQQYGKTDDFLNKNNSHSDNPKYVEVDATEKKIKIHITPQTKAGTYAIKVIPQTN